jgi:hypothetical protein
MKKTIIVFLILLFAIGSINAYADEKKDKITTLIKAQGLLETWQQMIDSGRDETDKYARQMLDQFLMELSPNTEFKEKFNKVMDKFTSNARSRWTAQYLVDLWAQIYGPKFSEAELDEMIKYYSSSIGQKEKLAGREAIKEFSKILQEKSQSVLQKALAQYIEDIKIIVNECKCKKL